MVRAAGVRPGALGLRGRRAARPVAHLRWLAELGAESLAIGPRPGAISGAPLVVSVPGAAYVFDRESDGRLRKRARLPADSAAANGLAVSGAELALADKLGTVSVWAVPATGDLRLRWRRELGERVTSLGWDGGPLVFAATWGGRLTALSAADGSLEVVRRHRRSCRGAGGRRRQRGVRRHQGEGAAAHRHENGCRALESGVARRRPASPGVPQGAVARRRRRPPRPRRRARCSSAPGTASSLAFDVLTGRLAWSTPLEAKLAAAPLVAPGLVAVVTADGAVRAYDLSGHALWAAPGAADGPATLFWQESAGTAARLLSVSRVLVGLSPSTGERSVDYPRGALDELQRRFADAMLEGVKTYSGAEKQAIQEQEAFEIAGPLFGPARVFGDGGSAGCVAGVRQRRRLGLPVRRHDAPSAGALSRGAAGRRAHRASRADGS